MTECEFINAIIDSLPEEARQAHERVLAEADRIEARVDPIGRIIRRVMDDGVKTKDGAA